MLKKWLEDVLGITKLKRDINTLKRRRIEDVGYIDNLVSELRRYTRVDADVGVRGNNTIVLTGVIHNKGYVRFYDVGDGEFKQLVDQLRDMQKFALIRNIDKPPNLTGVFDILRSGNDGE